MHPTFEEKAKDIKLLICDVDGVLTTGKLYFDAQGGEIKVFHAHDGYGIKALLQTGVTVALITARTHAAVQKRAAELGIQHVYMGQKDKRTAYAELKHTLGLVDSQIAYMGDDMPDATVMEQVHLPIAVANAVDAIKSLTPYHTDRKGGKGAVREVCDRIRGAQES